VTAAIEVFDDFPMVFVPSLVVVFAIASGVAVTAAIVAVAVRRWRARRPALVRTNYRGVAVPVILGDAVVAGSLAGLVLVASIELAIQAPLVIVLAVIAVVVVMWAVGAWDDRKGDERARGFRGHLGALRTRSLTGGVLKIAGGLVAGMIAAPLLPLRGAAPLAHVVETVVLVGLTANAVNLFDRAPGRAGKVTLLVGIPLALFGDPLWRLAATPVLGAVAGALRSDLREDAMLGDAGANPLGAVIGVGLVASLDQPGRLTAITILLVLTLASEKWSFSRAIEATPPLRWLDGLGRKDQVAAK